jgi:hemerythrin
MALSWDVSLLLRVPEIDAQHQELFGRLDALLDAIRAGNSRDVIGQTLTYLCEYVIRHFAAEENLMAERGYPKLPDHRTEHHAFAAELRELQAEFDRNGPSASLIIRVNTQLASWLRSHVMRTDRALADFLRPGA